MKGVISGRHLACFADQSGSPGLSITSLCTGVHARVISMLCLPQLRRLDVFGKLTVPHMAGLSGRSSSWRQASLCETHLVPSSGCHASLSAWGSFSLFENDHCLTYCSGMSPFMAVLPQGLKDLIRKWRRLGFLQWPVGFMVTKMETLKGTHLEVCP